MPERRYTDDSMRDLDLPDWARPAARGPWLKIALIAIPLLILVFTSFITIPADSVGVRTRFGAYVDTFTPGLRWKLPFGIDSVQLVPAERQLKLEFGFTTEAQGGSNPNQYPDDPDAEKNMLTGDLNMALVEWVVQYRITDPRQFLFHVFQPEWTLRDAGETVMREVVGDRTIDEVLTFGRQDIENEARVKLEQLIQKYGLGLSVSQVQLQNVLPPRPVQASFNEVNQAQQEKQQAINLANGEYNKVVPRARGEAQRRLSEAEGYATRRVNEARGDADRFNSLFAEYQKAPEVMRQRIYLETMRDVLPQFERKVIIDENARQVLPLLQLDGSNTQPVRIPVPTR
jgi:modulator of FtsH protease HflK